LGRLMRLPGARAKQEESLNRAYGFATSARFRAAAEALVGGLVANGFERFEARAAIEGEQGGLFTETDEPVLEFLGQRLRVETLAPELREKIEQRELLQGEGLGVRIEVRYRGP